MLSAGAKQGKARTDVSNVGFGSVSTVTEIFHPILPKRFTGGVWRQYAVCRYMPWLKSGN